jgi:hypothetical protein
MASLLAGDATDRIRRYHRSGKWLSDIGKSNNTKVFSSPTPDGLQRRFGA